MSGKDKTPVATKVNKATGKVYIANFDGDEIDGTFYSYGEEIAEGVDAGTVRFLCENGRLTELSEGDPLVPASAKGDNVATGGGLKAVSDMNRVEMLHELGGSIPDHELRNAVEAQRQRNAEGDKGGQDDEPPARAPRARRAAAPPPPEKAAPESKPDADEFDAEAFIDRTLDEITDEDLAALTPEQRAAVKAAEEDREQPRVGLTERLTKLDEPPAA